MATMSDLKRRMASTARWMLVLESGLNGRPSIVGMSEGVALERSLARLGVRLLSKTKGAKEKLELRRGAKPVLRRYFGAPISDYRDLYCIEQFQPIAAVRKSKSITKIG